MAAVEKTMDTGGVVADAAAHSAAMASSKDDRTSPTQFARLRWRNRLSSKLLILTALAVLIAEVLIFVPSIANMRVRWMSSRLDTVDAVSEVLIASGNINIPREVQDKVLLATGTKAIALREAGASHLLAMSEMPGNIDQVVDLNNISEAAAIWDAFGTLFNGGNRTLRIYGSNPPSATPGRIIEIVTSDAPLRHAMLSYATNVAIISLLISVIAASLIYLLIHEMLLRPVRLMHRNMIDFASAPDNPTRILVPENRKDEFGIAQRQIAHIQSDLQRTLKEQKHLADLGLAVSKINHDMRNILASAQLMSDRLADTRDPMVQRFAPKLIHTLSRAINYSESVMAYGRSQEAPPAPRRVQLSTVILDVQETLNLRTESGIEFENLIPIDFELNVDSNSCFVCCTIFAATRYRPWSAITAVMYPPSSALRFLQEESGRRQSLAWKTQALAYRRRHATTSLQHLRGPHAATARALVLLLLRNWCERMEARLSCARIAPSARISRFAFLTCRTGPKVAAINTQATTRSGSNLSCEPRSDI